MPPRTPLSSNVRAMGKVAFQISAPIAVALLSPLVLMPFPPKFYFVIALVAIPVVLVFTAVVAFPLYLLVPKQLRSNGMAMSGHAFFAGAISYMFIQLLLQPDYSRLGNVVYVSDGDFTHDGWVRALTAAVIAGFVAIPGGLLWSAAQRSGPDKSLERTRET